MLFSRGTNLRTNFLGILIGILALLITACGDNSTNSNGNSSNGVNTIEGEVSDYDLGTQELYKSEDFVDLIEGSIEADGSFAIEFFGREAIQEALKPLAEDSEGYVGMYCRSEIIESIGSDPLFVDVAYFNFTYGEENNVGGVALSSNTVNRNIYPPQSETRGEYQVRWIYSSEEISISENCQSGSSGTEEVELELSEGWNEVIFDVSDRDNKIMYTGERPSQVNWVVGT